MPPLRTAVDSGLKLTSYDAGESGISVNKRWLPFVQRRMVRLLIRLLKPLALHSQSSPRHPENRIFC